MPPRLVVFDMDEVLVHFRPQLRLEYLSRLTGLPAQQIYEAIWNSDFETAAEAGAWPDPDDYLAEFNRRIGTRLSVAQWIEGRRLAMQLRPQMLALAQEVGRRVPIAMLTNNGSLLKRSLPQLVPEICEIFGERAHASFEFGARKPDPQVFGRIAAHYGVDTEAVWFIDDNADFVNGALACGMRGFVFRDVVSLRAGLEEILLAR